MFFNKYLWLVLALMLVSGKALTITASAETTLSYSSPLPATHIFNEDGLAPYFKAVQHKTEGELKINLYPGGSLVGTRATLSGIEDGIVDGGTFFDVYTPTALPISTLLSGFRQFGDTHPRLLMMAMTAAVNEMDLVDCENCDIGKNHDVVPLAIAATGPFNFLCTKPLTSLADFRGKKIRSVGSDAVIVKALGATPVDLPVTGIYEAMNRGQIDCTSGSNSHLSNYSLWDLVEGVSEVGLGTSHGSYVLVFSKSVWDELSTKNKNVLIKESPKLIRDIVENYASNENHVRQIGIKRGVAWVKPDDDVAQVLNRQRKQQVARLAAIASKRGVKDPKKYISRFKRVIAKWKRIVSAPDYSFNDYESDLKKKIYSKLIIK